MLQAAEYRLQHPDLPVAVDWTGEHDFYQVPFGGNLFDEVFQPLPPTTSPPLELPAMRFAAVGRSTGWAYLAPDWNKLRRKLHGVFSELFQPRPDVPVWEIKGLVGAIYRTETNVSREQLTGHLVPIEAFADAVEEEANGRDIWMCAHAESAMAYFRDRWKDRLRHSCMSRTSAEGAPHRGQGGEHLRQAYAEIATLAKCETLVHGCSHMATAALALNPTLKHRFLQWKPAPLLPRCLVKKLVPRAL